MSEEAALQPEASRPLLVYDGDCPLCIAAVRGLAAMKLVSPARTRAFEELTGEDAARIWDAGIKNEMAAFLPTGEIRSGVRALLWTLEGGLLAPFARLCARRPIVDVLSAGYRLVSYNRRILVPARPKAIACACDPDFHLGYRLGLVALLLASSVALTALFGATVDLRGEPSSAWRRALDMLVLAGSGWGLAMLFALVLPFQRYVTWLGHLAVTMNAGLLVLLPATLLANFVSGTALQVVQGISVAASFALMFRMQWCRAKVQELGRRSPLIWAACLSAAPLVFLYALEIL